MNGRTIRATLVTCGFLAMVLAVTIGATGRGESYEVPVADICESTAWPFIPGPCLDDAKGRDIRLVGMVADASQVMAQAEIKTEAPVVNNSGKGDLLRAPEPAGVRYIVVETRGNGVSVLRRVGIEAQH